MKQKHSKALSLFLAFVMVLGLLPATVIPAQAAGNAIADYSYSSEGIEYRVVNAAGTTIANHASVDHQAGFYLVAESWSGTSAAVEIPDHATIVFKNGEKEVPVKSVDSDIAYTPSGSGVRFKDVVKHLKLGKNIQWLDDRCFVGCVLETVEIPEDSNLQTIKDNAFASCAYLRVIGDKVSGRLPASLTAIREYAFDDCTSLTKIDASSCPELSDIYTCAFTGCSALTTVLLPTSGTRLGVEQNAFSRSGITAITFPAHTTYLGPRLFENCADLQSVTFLSKMLGGGNMLRGVNHCSVYVDFNKTPYPPLPRTASPPR